MRLPFDPLARLADDTGALARLIGRPRRVVCRWKVDGVPYWSADAAAVRLGHHPANLWPEWFEVSPRPVPLGHCRMHQRAVADCAACDRARARVDA